MKRVAVTYGTAKKAPPYADAVRDAGGEPMLVAAADGVLSLGGFDGLLLSGGTDVDPRLYDETSDPRTQTPDRPRDALELTLLREARERDLPVLAICRGMQLFNVAHPGGTLQQHIDGHEVRLPDVSEPAHVVNVAPGSALAAILGAVEARVNSRHHQAVARVGEGLVVSARAPDGVIEGLELPGRRFAIAVQWHPEDQLRFPEQRRLFSAFIEAM
jgi:putative glutamine amidotransferase